MDLEVVVGARQEDRVALVAPDSSRGIDWDEHVPSKLTRLGCGVGAIDAAAINPISGCGLLGRNCSVGPIVLELSSFSRPRSLLRSKTHETSLAKQTSTDVVILALC